MPVRVRLYGRLRQVVPTQEIVLDSPVGTIGELIDRLCKMNPELADLIFESSGSPQLGRLIILVNGQSVKLLDGLDTLILGGATVAVDRIEILEAVGGG